MRKLEITYIDPALISPNRYNPNVHNADSFDGLLESIRYFGFTQPIVVDENTMEIVDGENRWRCAMVLDLPEVPVCFIRLSENDRRIATLLHNEARGVHNAQTRKKIETYLAKQGVDLDERMKKNNINR